MNTRSINQEDVAEFLRQITTAHTYAELEKSDESFIELAKRQAEAAEAYLLSDEINEAKSLFRYSLESLSHANRPDIEADFCERIGKAFSRAGKNSNAAGYFLKALTTNEITSQNTPENRTGLLKSYKLCADSLMKTNRSDDAIALLTKCCDVMKRGYETAPSLSDLMGWADALYMLGGAYEHIEAYEVSSKLYGEAMDLYIYAENDYKSDARRETANCLIKIGGIFELKKEYDRALENYNKALEINRRLAVRDGDELSLKHLMASCTHTAEDDGTSC